MSVKNFKFVSPGVFINEIDDSFLPKQADAIGPVVIGRSRRGLAMQPTKVQSYSEFVEVFGDTVPGKGAGDVWRDGNYQSPMYGTYAAQAFLKANVAPLTYIRLLGQDSDNATAGTAGVAGWQTADDPTDALGTNGGAFGLWLFLSASTTVGTVGTNGANLGTGHLAAVWYLNKSASIQLTGTMYHSGNILKQRRAGVGMVIKSFDTDKYTVSLSSSTQGTQKISFNFDQTGDDYIRNAFDTNPQLASEPGTFFNAGAARNYWLGDTYGQSLRDNGLVGAVSYGVILPIAQNSTNAKGPHRMRRASREAMTGWFIGQSQVTASSFQPQTEQRLFRLKGRGHGKWLHTNCKVSIANIRKSPTTLTDYGTFSVIIRPISDTDTRLVQMERFDNLTLDPRSPNFIERRIGNQFTTWNQTTLSLRTVGDFPNNSKFVYVDMNIDAADGGTPESLLPWGYFGPPKFKTTTTITGSGVAPILDDTFVYYPASGLVNGSTATPLSGAVNIAGRPLEGELSGTLTFPQVRLRLSQSGGGSTTSTTFFGFETTTVTGGDANDKSCPGYQNLLYGSMPEDPTADTNSQNPATLSGASAWAYMFSMDDLVKNSTGGYYYVSGSRMARAAAGQTEQGYSTTLTDGFRGFTAPFWGGFDGFDILKPNPMYNKGMIEGTSTEENDYIYYTWKRALDTVADAEFIDMNVLTAPGLTMPPLTTHAVRTCEERGDSLAIIDLPDVYLPSAEQHNSNRANRVATTPTAAATALKARVIDSSYGCTYYPWVQTRDEPTGQLLWIPPSVAMLGVFGSSERASELWFAPAGFNRGGLTDRAAGINVTAVTERLTSKDRDTLYDAHINPIASFPSTGIVVFGQKTLQERQSALDRINVRRLVIYLKKQISILSSQILFEQNVQDTWTRFRNLIEPLLSNVQTNYGITDYRLILDETTTTPDLVDQNIMYAKIMVKPARAIEFIAIDFVIMSTGASFDD
jgi:hypothetical protein